MAINAVEKCEKNPVPNPTSTSKAGRLPKVLVEPDDTAKRSKSKKKGKHSPYLHNEKVQLLSRITEKRLFQRKDELFSSFPFATNIYKASSDEFKALKKKQKTKKSVLTLPNDPAPIPQSCTVSDMNDSEYRKSSKKRVPNPHRKSPVKFQGFEFYDREGHLDISSTEIIGKNYDGDGKKVAKNKRKTEKEDFNAQDVWTVLRNINKFQFKLSPHLSDENVSLPKKKTNCKRHSNMRKGRRLIETHRTEEIAYVANFEIQSKTSISQSSSFDRVTVINKNDLSKNELEAFKVNKNQNILRLPNKHKNFNNSYKCLPKNITKALQIKDNRSMMNKNRPSNDFHKIDNAAIGSTETIKGSIDSSNYYRCDGNDSFTCVPKVKTLSHPNEIEEIIQESLVHNRDKLTKSAAEAYNTDQAPKRTNRSILNNETAPAPGRTDSNLQKRKPRLVTTMPSAAAMPKLTAADIKRKLAHIKFPLVVLGKDQLSSTVEVLDYEPPQFNGLNEHVWPFMMEWSKHGHARKGHSNSQRRESPIERITNNLREVSNDLSVIRTNDKYANRRTDHKRWLQKDESPPNHKRKAARQTKDKMLKLLYIKPDCEVHDLKNDNVPSKHELKMKKSEDCTEPTEPLLEHKSEVLRQYEELDMVPDDLPKKQIVLRFSRRPTPAANILPGIKHPWSRAKMASDFVDNVMQKIKNGAYYSHDDSFNWNNNPTNNAIQKLDIGTCFDFKDVSIQTFEDTKLDFEQNFTQSSVTLAIEDANSRITIPGFDNVLPQLELKTLNINQVAVKHCQTNVMVQFDVAVPDKSRKLSLDNISAFTNSSYVPVSVSESQTRIFKCNTTILNAVLPAELCSMIPTVIRNLFDNEAKFTSSSCKDSLMSISELSDFESRTVINLRCGFDKLDFATLKRPVCPEWVYPPNADWITPQSSQTTYATPVVPPMASQDHPWIVSWLPKYNFSLNVIEEMSPKLQNLISGTFSLTDVKKSVSKEEVIKKLRRSLSAINLVTNLQTTSVMPIVVDPRSLIMPKAGKDIPVSESSKLKMPETLLNPCTAIEVYGGVKTLSTLPRIEENWIPRHADFTALLQYMWKYCKFNIHLNIPIPASTYPLAQTNCDSMEIQSNAGSCIHSMSITITELSLDSLYNGFAKSNQCGKETKVRNVLPLDCPKCEDMITEKIKSTTARKTHERGRKRVYIKLYKKCKSTSNISSERTSTALNKIGNLDDFVQALGSAKALSSVLDGAAGKKILTCVDEMKLWISDISPRQALLVLLLSNKKDTPNLLKFRPIILQGIAVNRITRATELDMEIEVIERENLKLRQFEGISYLPASMANKNNLMEELCWIAKTTASDYQRPFDESSEKLLKSLIEKRKKLNPSYLRVMARYVGLGLLKPQDKK